MQTRSLSVLSILVTAAILSGCIGGDDDAPTDTDGLSDDAEDAKVTDTTGSIKGTVASDLFEPLAGATVALVESAQETKVARNGEFTINDVEPGRYTLHTVALGYLPSTRAVEVAAGEITQVAIQLSPEPSTDPFVESIHIAGEISSSVIWQIEVPTQGCIVGPAQIGYDKTCGGFGGGTNSQVKINVTGTVETFLVELVWKPAGPLGEYLQLDVICPDAPRGGGGSILDTSHPCYYLAPGSSSPLIVRVDKTDSENTYNWTGDWDGRVFANYGMLGTYDLTGVDAGVAYQQKFEWYITKFHRQVAPEGYTGIPDQ